MAVQWENVYVFISSTFSDMHAERDYLVKQVFPRLQEWCDRRKLRLVDIDLRWGVAESAATGRNVVKVCLDFIDRCRPFFLCFLGQRYGWIPRATAAGGEPLSPDTYQRFQGLKPVVDEYTSVTEIEILHALVRPFPVGGQQVRYQPAEHSFFYFRDPSYLRALPESPDAVRRTYTDLTSPRDPQEVEWIYADAPAGPADDYLALGDLSAEQRARLGWAPGTPQPAPGSPAFRLQKLRLLKARTIPASSRACRRYTAGWMERASTPEIALTLACPSPSPDKVTEWRRRWLEEANLEVTGFEVPADPESQRAAQEYNARLTHGRLGHFACGGRPLADVVIEDLQAAISARYPGRDEAVAPDELHSELERHEEFLYNAAQGFIERTGDFDALDRYVAGDDRHLFVLTAEGGMGKSTLLAKWIDRLRQRASADPGTSIHFRFVGIGEHTASVSSLLGLLVRELEECGKLDPWKPSDPKELREFFPRELAACGKKGRTIIVLDALNQLETGLADLEWLPRPLPEGVKLIVSFKTGEAQGDAAETLFAQDARVLVTRVQPFADAQDRRRLVDVYLSQFLKELGEEHLEALIGVEGAQNPLYLKVALSELRVFGSFEQLGRAIGTQFGDTPVTAFDAVLRRLESDPAYTPLEPAAAVPLLFGFLAHGLAGLPEDLLARLMLRELGMEIGEATRQHALDTIRHFLRQMRPFLARREGRPDFFYESFAEAARARYASPGSGRRPPEEWHRKIAAECEDWRRLEGGLRKYALANLVHHYLRASQLEQAARTLSDLPYLHARIHALGAEAVHRLVSDCHALETTAGAAAWSGQAREWTRFIRSNAHRFAALGAAELLQCAASISNDSPISRQADSFADQAGLQHAWLRKDNRPARHSPDPCLAVLSDPEGYVEYAVHVSELAFDPQGGRLFAWDDPSGFKAWDLNSGRLAHRLAATDATAHLMMAESSRALLARENDNHAIRLWDLTSGECLRVFQGHQGKVDAIASPRPDRVVSAAQDGTMRIWDAGSGECLKVIEARAGGLASLPGGERFLAGCAGRITRLYELSTGQCLAQYEGDLFLAYANGSRLLTKAGSSRLQIRDLSTGAARHAPPVPPELADIGPAGVKVFPGGRHAVWTVDDGKSLAMVALDSGGARILSGHTAPIREVYCHPGGVHLISAAQDGEVRIWNCQTGQTTHILGHQGPAAAALHPNGRWVATAAGDQCLRLWELDTGRLAHSQALPVAGIARILYNTGMLLFVLQQGSPGVYIFMPQFSRLSAIARVGSNPVTDIAVSLSGDRLLATDAHQIDVYTIGMRLGKRKLSFRGHSSRLRGAEFLPDGRHVISEDIFSNIYVWESETGKITGAFYGSGVAVIPDSNQILFREASTPLYQYDLETHSRLRELAISLEDPQEMRLHPDQRRLLAIDKGRRSVSLWDLETGSRVRSFAGGERTFECVAHSPEGANFLSSDNHSELRVWETATGKAQRALQAAPATAICAGPGGRLAASASMEDRKVRVWDLAAAGPAIAQEDQAGGVDFLEIVPGSPRVAAASSEGHLCVWDTARMTRQMALAGGARISAVAAHPGGRFLLTGSREGTLTLWDLDLGKAVRSFAGHTDAINAAAFLRDGRHALSASEDGTLRLWNLGFEGLPWVRGKCVRVFSGHAAPVQTLALQPDGRTFLSAAAEQSIRRWDLKTGKCLRVFETKEVVVNALAVHPGGRYFVSAHMDPRVGRLPEVGLQYWDSETGECLAGFKGLDSAMAAYFLPGGQEVLVGLTLNKMIQIDLTTGILAGVYSAGDADIAVALPHPMDLHPGGRYAVTAWAHFARLWDLDTQQNLASWYEESFITACRFLPDPSAIRIVCGTGQGQLSFLTLQNAAHAVSRKQPEGKGYFFHRAYLVPRQKVVIPELKTV